MSLLHYCIAGLLGALVGSFLNVCIYRLPTALFSRYREQAQSFLFPQHVVRPAAHWLQALSWPSSHCPHCHQSLAWYHNIPLVSFMVLRGRCAFCRVPISSQYYWVEFISGLFTAFALWHTGHIIDTLILSVIFWLLLVMAVIDYRTYYLPDELTAPLLWGGIFYHAFYWGAPLSIQSSLMGVALGYGLLWSADRLYYFIRKKQGMGEGDLTLMAALGAWVGPQGAITVVFISAVLGTVLGSLLLLYRRQSHQTPIPFGPFLAFGGLLVILYPHLQLI